MKKGRNLSAPAQSNP